MNIESIKNEAVHWRNSKPILQAKNGPYVLLPLEYRLWSKVDVGEGCWNWIGYKNVYGYGMLRSKPKGSKNIYLVAHRLSWTLNCGPIPKGIFVCHHCDNPACVRPDHLFLGTGKDNMQDCAKKGRLHTQKKRRKK